MRVTSYVSFMGRLTFATALVADFDDRVLAHLQVTIAAKLRRGESFTFTWREDGDRGGRNVVWVHPAHVLAFRYLGSTPPTINRAWIELLTEAANSAGGLRALPEPTEQISPATG